MYIKAKEQINHTLISDKFNGYLIFDNSFQVVGHEFRFSVEYKESNLNEILDLITKIR